MTFEQHSLELLVFILIAVIGVILIVRALTMPASHREREAKREKLRKLKLELREEAEDSNESEDKSQ
jgi:flagellar biosynthesis/type III secretory pathway M-ring protein FliF/YscJ